MARPDPASMTDAHLLDDYLTVYRDGGKRRGAIRAELEKRLAEVERLRAENESLLRIINDSFMSLHSPYSTLAFDGRNLTPHVEEASRAAAILHGELGEARREVKRLREDINVEALNEDCWALIRAVGLPDHARPTSCHRVVVGEIIPAIERLRGELREAVRLLREVPGQCDWCIYHEHKPWFVAVSALLGRVGHD